MSTTEQPAKPKNQYDERLAKYSRENLGVTQTTPELPPNLTEKPEPEANKDGLKEYQAFAVRDKVPHDLRIMKELEESYRLDYRYYQMMNDSNTQIAIYCTSVIVKIYGRNLLPVASAISDRVCNAIYQFHPEAHIAPLPQEPIIEKIEILKREG
jgi:hypothetical protein